MAKILSKNNVFLEDESDPLALHVESTFYPEKNELRTEDDSGGGESGDDTHGGIALSVEQLNAYLLAAFNQDRRQRLDGQRKFGACPISEDPNNLLRNKTARACGFGESIQMHPLLASSQQFSGVDPKICPIPSDNPKARERFPELRLENKLRLQQNLGLDRNKSVTLAR